MVTTENDFKDSGMFCQLAALMTYNAVTLNEAICDSLKMPIGVSDSVLLHVVLSLPLSLLICLRDSTLPLSSLKIYSLLNPTFLSFAFLGF